jgi:hypothetical protein
MPKLTVQQKLIELHEKLDAIEQERDALKAKSSWWTNPAMIAALAGLLTAVGASVENMWARYQARLETKQDTSVERTTHKGVYKFLIQQQKESDEILTSYIKVVVGVLTPYQRRQVKDQIEELELPELDVVAVQSSPEITLQPIVLPSVAEADSSKKVAEEVKAPDNLFDAVQMQVKNRGIIDFSELKDRFSVRAKSHDKR